MDNVVRCKEPRDNIDREQLSDVDLSYANGDGNVNAIFSNTDKNGWEIAVFLEMLVLPTGVSHGIQMS